MQGIGAIDCSQARDVKVRDGFSILYGNLWELTAERGKCSRCSAYEFRSNILLPPSRPKTIFDQYCSFGARRQATCFLYLIIDSKGCRTKSVGGRNQDRRSEQ